MAFNGKLCVCVCVFMNGNSRVEMCGLNWSQFSVFEKKKNGTIFFINFYLNKKLI